MKLNELEMDEEYVIHRRKFHRDSKPPFTMIGNGALNKTGTSMDVIQILTELSPAAIKLFNTMLRRRNVDTNEVVLRPGDADTPRVIANHMPQLIEKEIVLRMSNCRYLINPDFVIPNNYRSTKDLWRKQVVLLEDSQVINQIE